MFAVYLYGDRTIWVQPLPLTDEQERKVITKLEYDIQEDHKHYAYDHFWDNCTTRVRDVLDVAIGLARHAGVDDAERDVTVALPDQAADAHRDELDRARAGRVELGMRADIREVVGDRDAGLCRRRARESDQDGERDSQHSRVV